MLTTDTRAAMRIFGGSLHPDEQFLYPERTHVIDRITRCFRLLRERGVSTTLVDGAFDVPHPNHEAYLRHCRLLGAEAALLADGQLLTDEAREAALLSDGIHLTVTVDADEKVHSKKSGKGDKGGVARPIYSWQARAERIAGYVFELDGQLRRTVDLVTVEGDMTEHSRTPLESSLEFAEYLKRHGLLDHFIVFGEHASTVDDAAAAGLQPIVIPHETSYYTNPQTDRPYSSSAIIRRAQGEDVPHPITKPVQRGTA